MGIGKVVEVQTLKGTVLVDLPETGIKEFQKEELSPVDPSQLPQEKKDKPQRQDRKRRSR